MTVTFIKRECDRHPGCFTMTDKCDRCHDEDHNERMTAIWDRFRNDCKRIFAASSQVDGNT